MGDPVTLLLVAYFAILGLLAVIGLHRLFLVVLFHRHAASANRQPPGRLDELPVVTVQLPLFNERTVAVRLLEAVAALDWPREKLHVQVLDDSTDETPAVLAPVIDRLRDDGVDIEHIRRPDRHGYKAGALAHGLTAARGEFVAIFDADFVPRPGFLRDTIDWFADPAVGLVQARWSHLNRRFSALTGAQAVLLDAHFVVEHFARNRSGRFFNFNGTAGVWRRAAIDDAGGWAHETLTEDLDLSYRAQLRGWQFVFLPQIDAPAELPVEMDAFKSQQYRWTKGSVQVARKLLPAIWRARVPLRVKAEATIHLTANISYLLMMALALLIGPAVWVRARVGGWEDLLLVDLPVFFFGTLAVCDFFLTAQRQLGRPLGRSLARLPVCLALGMGLALNNARAVASGLLRRPSPFVRTPKYNITDATPAGDRPAGPYRPYRPGRSLLPWLELMLGLYFVVATVVALSPGVSALPSLPFLMLFAAGFIYCAAGSLLPRLRRRPAAAPGAGPARTPLAVADPPAGV